MPSAPASVKELGNLIVRSKLMTADEVKGVVEYLPRTGKENEDVEAFRKQLIHNKYLTEYQAALLMRGHSEGFFLDHYKILELIAKGRMAGVYKARHTSGQTVAIKVLPSSKARDTELLARFKREARLLTKLDHPNVVRAFQLGESAGKYYLVMEYLEGETLEEVLEKRTRLPPSEAVRVIHQALNGLQHIYERGMIHRDLKPGNIILVDTGHAKRDRDTLDCAVKILDIGLGKSIFEDNVKSSPEDPSQLTNDGTLLGTPDYLAPEQARNASSADIRSDIYSLGCVLYHALTGQPPFPDKSVLNQVLRHTNETPKPLSDFLQTVPDGLQNALNWMMAKKPADRFQTPDKAAQALHVFLKLTHTPTTLPIPGPLPGFVKWLEDTGEIEKPKSVANPLPAIPVGVLAGETRKGNALRSTPTSKITPPRALPVSKQTPVETPKPADVIKPVVASKQISDYDVELINLDSISDATVRHPLDLNRRDVIMLTAGGSFVAIAIGLGYGLSRLLSRSIEVNEPHTEDNDHKKE